MLGAAANAFHGQLPHRRRPEREATAQAAITPRTPPVETEESAPLAPPAAFVALAELEPLAVEFEGEVALPLAAELVRVAVGAACAVPVNVRRKFRMS